MMEFRLDPAESCDSCSVVGAAAERMSTIVSLAARTAEFGERAAGFLKGDAEPSAALDALARALASLASVGGLVLEETGEAACAAAFRDVTGKLESVITGVSDKIRTPA